MKPPTRKSARKHFAVSLNEKNLDLADLKKRGLFFRV